MAAWQLQLMELYGIHRMVHLPYLVVEHVLHLTGMVDGWSVRIPVEKFIIPTIMETPGL